MEVKPVLLGYDGEDEQLVGTEVVFMSHEENGLQLLMQRLLESRQDIHFELRHGDNNTSQSLASIVMDRYLSVKGVHRIMTGATSEPRTRGPFKFSRHEELYGPTIVVQPNPKYL